MNFHRATLIPINGNQPSESTEIGRDEHELIEAAVEHYLQHFLRMQGDLKAEQLWWERRANPSNAADYQDSQWHLGCKLQKLRSLTDKIAAAHALHIIPQED